MDGVLANISWTGIVAAGLLLIAAAVLLSWIGGLLDFFTQRVPRTRFFFNRLRPILRLAIWVIVAVSSVRLVVPDQNAFFAAMTGLGLAVGLGAQDLIKNLIGGLVVLTDRPYQLGDRVKIGDAYGEINHIGLRSTKLTTPDDTLVTIPNADVLSAHIYNSNSGVPDCQVVTDIFLPTDSDPDVALDIGREAAYLSPFTIPTKPVVALISDQYGDGPFMRLRVKAYVHEHRFESAMQSDITSRAKVELNNRGLLNAWTHQYADVSANHPDTEPKVTPAG